MKKAIWILIAILIVSIAFNVGMLFRIHKLKDVNNDTVTVESYYDVKDYAPKAKDEVVVGQVSVPVVSSSSRNGKNGRVKKSQESLHNVNDVSKDSSFFYISQGEKGDSVCDGRVILDVVQRRYSNDSSSYVAYVSGVRAGDYPRLDSVSVSNKIIDRTITRPSDKKKKHWSYGIGVLTGVSVTTGKPDIVAGLYLGYSF